MQLPVVHVDITPDPVLARAALVPHRMFGAIRSLSYFVNLHFSLI